MSADKASSDSPLLIDGVQLGSRFFLGTAAYASPDILLHSMRQSGASIFTMGLKRQLAVGGDNGVVQMIAQTAAELGAKILPNTAGCRSAHEAVQLAQMARELYNTAWIKLEVVGDEYTLQPDGFALLEAAEILVREGFTVFPYCTDDLVLCQKLLAVGCPVLMPWGAPIGSGQGLMNPYALRTLRRRLPEAILIVDAGIGAPSHAAAAMELGFDAVLLNSAVAQAGRSTAMAGAFGQAIAAGRTAYLSGIIAAQDFATPSTPVAGHPLLLD